MTDEINDLVEQEDSRPSWQRAIPLELDDTLFFMWANGMAYDDIVKHYADTPVAFNKKQLYRYAEKRGWKKRKEEIDREVKQDFRDILKQCQAKKMTAISMAIQTVSDIIIKDIHDYKSDPETFWKDVREYKRPKPFWLARNVDELSNLYKLQKFLEISDAAVDDQQKLPDDERSVILRALADAQKIAPTEEQKALLSTPDETIIDIEIEDKNDDSGPTSDRFEVDKTD